MITFNEINKGEQFKYGNLIFTKMDKVTGIYILEGKQKVHFFKSNDSVEIVE